MPRAICPSCGTKSFLDSEASKTAYPELRDIGFACELCWACRDELKQDDFVVVRDGPDIDRTGRIVQILNCSGRGTLFGVEFDKFDQFERSVQHFARMQLARNDNPVRVSGQLNSSKPSESNMPFREFNCRTFKLLGLRASCDFSTDASISFHLGHGTEQEIHVIGWLDVHYPSGRYGAYIRIGLPKQHLATNPLDETVIESLLDALGIPAGTKYDASCYGIDGGSGLTNIAYL